MKTLFAITVYFLAVVSTTIGQELDCDVSLNLESLTTTEAQDNLSDFVQQLKQYINNYRWLRDYEGNKIIKCAINISIHNSQGNNHYMAQAFIGSQRPIYKSSSNSAVLRLLDDQWEFDYIRNEALMHSESRYDPLLSFIDFYVYLILGYDADTYHTNGGTPYFQKAFEIVNLARGSGLDAKGWEQSPQNIYSRTQIVDELLNPKFQDFRKAVHTYHYWGLDSLFSNSPKSMKRILSSLDKIAKLKNKINQSSLIIRSFFDTKYLEIAEIFLKSANPSIYARLSRIDPAHQKTYDEYQTKRE